MAAQRLPAAAPGRPALQKLAGLYQEAQLILVSARTSDPPKGILTLRLFSSELLPEHLDLSQETALITPGR